MDKSAERRKLFKSPPTELRLSQEARRAQALEEQKRKRLQRVDASRHLDQFAGLSLGVSDDEEDDGDEQSGSPSSPRMMEGVAQFSSMLPVPDSEPPPQSRSPSPYVEQGDSAGKSKKKKKKGKGKKKQSKWANKCMYAELLEMREDTLWTNSWDAGGAPQHDGLPDDLETSWVGLAPVPVGKRCLAVTMQSAGVSGIVPNTILRSRLLGKVLIHPFPSPLPPNTILDCILDQNWRANGLLHVLDVVRWKSQDVAECEASFRFWWRDTRLSEMPVWPPPPPHKSTFSNANPSSHPSYRFPYPTTFVPVPYAAPTSFEHLLGDLLSRARNGRDMRLKLPVLPASASSKESAKDEDMQIDHSSGQGIPRGVWSVDQIQEVEVPIMSDGLLLYVGEAAYESGESPLSVWVPRVSFECQPRDEGTTGADSMAEAFGERSEMLVGKKESPLDSFERLIRRRLVARQSGLAAVGKNAPDAFHIANNGPIEVEMET